MEAAMVSLTAVYLRSEHGFVGFVEELPGLSSHGQTIEQARLNLRRLAQVVFEEERAQSEALLEGKEVVRESFLVKLPRSTRPVGV
jgi:predicted RNase H-like HicB family nuclease